MNLLDSKFQILGILFLSLVSISFQHDPTCGNGFLDSGEECDCGTQQDCNRVGNTCCKDCKFIARGTICRQATNFCDVPEYCNGTSANCPADLVTANGISCNNDKGYCHKGECRTHSEQCNEIWNGGAYKADDACYQLNLRGDIHGHCKTEASTYIPCASKNIQCGKLWCTGNTIITPKDRGNFYLPVVATLNNRRIICRSVQIYQGQGLPELGTVLDGTKCGNKKVCKNNECVSLSVAYGGQRTCPNNCNGNGVCNEYGNCHCNPRWKCPNCSEAYNGPGGSSDSGLDCKPVKKPPCQCTQGGCCKNCQIVTQRTICRYAANSCDVPEYCDGTSEICPTDLKTTNGISCSNDHEQGYCLAGECRTYNEQCNDLWFGDAFKASHLCYEQYNVLGNKHGYCKRHSKTSYTPCTLKNSHCGKLWCVGNGPITQKSLGYGDYWTYGTVSNKKFECRSVIIYQAPGKPALGTVLDGTKCGNNMVCKDNECVPLSVAYGGQPTCVNNCNGNGVCNENGYCHCNPGWKCPNCAEAYEDLSGRSHNGFNCQFFVTTSKTTVATTTPSAAATTPSEPATTLSVPATTLSVPATTLSVLATTPTATATTLSVSTTTPSAAATILSKLATTLSAPATTLSVPATTLSTPATTLSVPATTSSIPETTPSVPATAPSVPATTLSLPATTLPASATTPSVLPTTPLASEKTPSVPETALSAPNTTSSVPAKTSSVPNTSPPAGTIRKTKQSSNDKSWNDKIKIPLAIALPCFFLLLLLVIIYRYTNQCRFCQNTIGRRNSEQNHENNAFDPTQEPIEEFFSYPNDMLRERAIESFRSTWLARISTGQEPMQKPGYVSLKNDREPASF